MVFQKADMTRSHVGFLMRSGPQADTLEEMSVGSCGLGSEEVGAETDEEVPVG